MYSNWQNSFISKKQLPTHLKNEIYTMFYQCTNHGSQRVKMHETGLTWDLVSMTLKHEPVLQFQKRIHRSAVPPPLANVLGCHGHHANAFTAA
jgi:hypothetical protein